MPTKRWVSWLIVLLGLITAGQGLGWLMVAQGFPTTGYIVRTIGEIATYFWLVVGIFALAQTHWLVWTIIHQVVAIAGVAIALTFFYLQASGAGLVLIGVAIFLRGVVVYRAYTTLPDWRKAAICVLAANDILFLCWLCVRHDHTDTAYIIGGMTAMAVMLIVGLWLIRKVLSPGIAAFGVARTLINEAMGMNIALVFIAILMLMVPVLPYTTDSNDFLRYRIGTFLAWSMWVTMIALSLMTIFLACATICREQQHRQIYMTLTKPIGRAEYLLGKWLGLVLLNLLLVSVASVGIYTFASLMGGMEARDGNDRIVVDEQVLAARVSLLPTPVGGVAQLNARIATEVADNANAGMYLDEQGQGRPPTAAEKRQVVNQILNKWHSIARLESQTYLFSGLGDAMHRVLSVQLKLKALADVPPTNRRLFVEIRVNGRPLPSGINVVDLHHDRVHVVNLPAQLIRPDGSLEVQIFNRHWQDKDKTPPTSISFTPQEGLQLLYRYGAFGPNLARAMVIVWILLCFLAMVGLSAGTFLGFPVASLLSTMVFATALASGYLGESLSEYAVAIEQDAAAWAVFTAYLTRFWSHLAAGEGWEAVKVPIQVLGHIFLTVVPSFSDHNPIPLIADGQVVEPKWVGRAALMIGLVWTAVTAVIGYLIFRRRELARVTV